MKKLFTNDRFFLAVSAIAILGEMFFSSLMLIAKPESIRSTGIFLLLAIFLLCVYCSYRDHSKNVMKGLMGSVLATLLMVSLSYLTEMETLFDKVFAPAFLVLVATLFVNHFSINADRHPSPKGVLLNQILSFLVAAVYLAWIICGIPALKDSTEILANIIHAVAFPCFIATIVCVESRLDAYRIDREAAGWTVEKGYPEGYEKPKTEIDL